MNKNNKYSLKKDAIIKDAKNMFLLYGYKKTTMDDIAKLIGIKKNTLYYYFESKEVLFNEVMKEDTEEIVNSLLVAVEKEKTCRTKLKAFITVFNKVTRLRTRKYPVTSKLLLEFIVVMESTKHEAADQILSMLRSILKEGIKTGEFVKHDTDELSLVLLEIALSHEYTQISKVLFEIVNENEIMGIDSGDRLFSKAVDYIINGIKK